MACRFDGKKYAAAADRSSYKTVRRDRVVHSVLTTLGTVNIYQMAEARSHASVVINIDGHY